MSELLKTNLDSLNLGETADFLKSLKDLKRSINDEINKIDKKISQVEGTLKAKLSELGTDIVRGKTVTVSISKTEVPEVEDWDSFYKYIVENDAPYLLQRRPSIAPIREIWSTGMNVDGLNIVEIEKINVKSL